MNSYLLSLIAIAGESPVFVEELTNITYLGYAAPGTVSEASPTFLVKRVEVQGPLTTTKYAEGSGRYDKKWSDRAIYEYKFMQ